MRQDGAAQQVYAFVEDEIVGRADRIAGIGTVVARHDLKFPPQHAAGGVDLLDREIHALAIGAHVGGHRFVAVDVSDADARLADFLTVSEAADRKDGEKHDDYGSNLHDGSPRYIGVVNADRTAGRRTAGAQAAVAPPAWAGARSASIKVSTIRRMRM